MPSKKLHINVIPSGRTVSIDKGKNESVFKIEDTEGIIQAVYLNADNRDLKYKLKIGLSAKKNYVLELPSNSVLNTMGLNQAAGYTHSTILREFYSSSAYGVALEHPIEFNGDFEITAHNEGSSTIAVSYYIVIWEEILG